MQRYFLFLMSFSLLIMSASLGGLGLMASGCGGSGTGSSGSSEGGGGAGASGGSGSGLTLTSSVSVVEAQDADSSLSTPALIKALGRIKAATSALPSTSPYFTDETHVFVEERSAEVFDVVNEILCMIDQLKYDDPALLNQGDYLAYVDPDLCDQGNDSVEGVGQSSEDGSSGDDFIAYENWFSNSFQADDNSSHIVANWIHMGGDEFEPAMYIEARTELTADRSDEHPNGVFQMNFRAWMDTGDVDKANDPEVMFGFLKVDENNVLQFFDSADFGEGMGFEEAVTLIQNGSSMSGRMRSIENMGESSGGSREIEYSVAGNEQYLLRSHGEDEVCLSRTDYETTNHRYNMYYSEDSSTPGELVTLNSGFPITFTDDSQNEFFGWIGYWGLWMPDDAQIENGDTVNKQTFGGPGAENTETPYTAYIVGGKLKKYTKQTLTLEEIGGVPLNWSQCSFDTGECANYQVEWNKDTQKLMKTHQINQENWIPEEITEAEVIFTSDDWDFHFWSQGLGGNGFVSITDPSTGIQKALTNSSGVTFHKEDVVLPGDSGIPTSFACVENCPDPSDPSSYIPASIPWEADENSYNTKAEQVAPGSLVAGTHYAAYTFDTTSMVLKSGATSILTEEEGEFGSGIWTGTLIPTSSLSQLACDYNSAQTCLWKAQQILSEYYTWETGPNSWNQLSLLQDPSTDTFLEFDPPISGEVELTLDDGDTVKIFPEYGGPGEIHLPGKCVNMDTGLDADCGDWDEDTPIRWVPAYNIPEGTVFTSGSDTYYVKPIDVEQRMIGVDVSLCTESGLALVNHDFPNENDYEEPVIGDEPALTVPAVIGGVLQ